MNANEKDSKRREAWNALDADLQSADSSPHAGVAPDMTKSDEYRGAGLDEKLNRRVRGCAQRD